MQFDTSVELCVDQLFHESSFKFSCMIASMSIFVKACLAPLGGTLWRRRPIWVAKHDSLNVSIDQVPMSRRKAQQWLKIHRLNFWWVCCATYCLHAWPRAANQSPVRPIHFNDFLIVLMTWFHHFWLDEGLTEISTQKCGKFESKRAKTWR